MATKQNEHDRKLEVALILVSVGLTCLLYRTNGYKLVVLNLFYLPVTLAAFFMGRYRAGVLALFCVVMASLAAVMGIDEFAEVTPPLVIGLAVMVWGAVLGLTAMLVGTLSDERAKQWQELHEAYLGIVEVLSRYLNSADPNRNDRSSRVAELSERVARHMRLPEKQIDDIRVAALLQDLENVEITAKVIRKAVGNLELSSGHASRQHTFHGSDMVQSLAAVLSGALPLICCSEESLDIATPTKSSRVSVDAALAAQIIRAVRAYEVLADRRLTLTPATPEELVEELRSDDGIVCHPSVLDALERVVAASGFTAPPASAADFDARVCESIG
ncbi:MAG TPA: HD domain-containing phosphohydrolase [Pirellulales bacterium]|jgi:hypothetical protein|nr:HD domain-containing phosphohydrolase [Pirellulales bacterium]